MQMAFPLSLDLGNRETKNPSAQVTYRRRLMENW